MSVQPAAPAASQAPIEDGEDLILTLPADAPLEDEISQQEAEKPEVTAAPVPPVAPVEGLEELHKQIASEKEERDRLTEQNRKLERDRAQFAQIAQEFQRRGMSAEEALLETQLTVATSATEAAKRDYKAAFEEGNADKMADAQERIATAASDKRALERDKSTFLAQRNAPQVQQVEADPIERALAGYTPTTQNWLRSHRDVFRSDGSLKRTAIDAHETAMDEGLAADTPAYFSRVEQILVGTRAPAAEVQPVPRPRNATTSTAAPVVRSALTSATKPGPNGEFRLTPKMRELAQASGAPESISYADWAKEYLRMVKTGEMQPIEG